MGFWGVGPLENDIAADFVYLLEGTDEWDIITSALERVLAQADDLIDIERCCEAYAAAEILAEGIGRPTQAESSENSASSFLRRAGRPPVSVVRLATQSVEALASPRSELAQAWHDDAEGEWRLAVARLRCALHQ